MVGYTPSATPRPDQYGRLKSCVNSSPMFASSSPVPTEGPTGPTGPTGQGLDILGATNYGDYLLYNGTSWVVASNTVALGQNSGEYLQGLNAVAIGSQAGRTGQGTSAIAIGTNAGITGQGEYSVAIGANTNNNGLQRCVAIGNNATNTQPNTIVLGTSAETTVLPGPVALYGPTSPGTSFFTTAPSSGSTGLTGFTQIHCLGSVYQYSFFQTSDFTFSAVLPNTNIITSFAIDNQVIPFGTYLCYVSIASMTVPSGSGTQTIYINILPSTTWSYLGASSNIIQNNVITGMNFLTTIQAYSSPTHWYVLGGLQSAPLMATIQYCTLTLTRIA